MATNVLHIASGLYFWIGASLSLSILDSKTVHECLKNRKIHAGIRKMKIGIKSITQSFLNESFEAFVV
jgi:hypothetical protein